MIQDENGYKHTFMHFKDPSKLEVGRNINPGDKLGDMGDFVNGKNNGQPHVHYEIRIEANGKNYKIDPVEYHDGKPLEEIRIMGDKKTGPVDLSQDPALRDALRQRRESEEAARREREGREEAKPPAPPPQNEAGADGSELGGNSANPAEAGEVRQAMRQGWRDSGQDKRPQQTMEERWPLPGEEREHPGAEFIRQERNMLHEVPQIEPARADRFDRLQGLAQEQPRGRVLPRPVNMLTDLLPPELDPDGSVNADLLRLRAENPALWGGTAEKQGSGLSELPSKSRRPPGYVSIYPELDREGDFAPPVRRTRTGGSGSGSLPGNDSEEMSTLDFIKETFRLAAQNEPETPRPQRPAWFKPSNPEELTTAEYIWDMFHPEAAKKYRR